MLNLEKQTLTFLKIGLSSFYGLMASSAVANDRYSPNNLLSNFSCVFAYKLIKSALWAHHFRSSGLYIHSLQPSDRSDPNLEGWFSMIWKTHTFSLIPKYHLSASHLHKYYCFHRSRLTEFYLRLSSFYLPTYFL